MGKPYMIDVDKLFRDLRELFKAHGWDESSAYDVAKECLQVALTSK